VEAAVEGELVLPGDPCRERHALPGPLGLRNRVRQLLHEHGRIVDLLVRVGPVLGHGPLVEVLAQPSREQRAGVRVRAHDQDVVAGDAGLLLGLLPRATRDLGGDADQVAEDQRRLLPALAEHEGLGLERVMNAGAQALAEIPAHPVRYRRGDVDHGHPGLKLRAPGGRRRGTDRHTQRTSQRPAQHQSHNDVSLKQRPQPDPSLSLARPGR